MPTVVHQQREENYVAILLASAVDSVSHRRHPWAAKNPFPVLLERRRFESRTQHFHILFHTAAAVLLAYCADHAVVRCHLLIRAFVCPSVMLQYCVNSTENIVEFFAA